jgi:hypothetical protein
MRPDIDSIRSAYPVAPHIAAAALAVRYDLLHGPSYSLIPAAGITAFNADSFASFASDLDGAAGSITETYSGPVGDALRDFIGDLPGALYVDESGYLIGEREPDGEWLNADGEPCGPYDDGAEWQESESYYVLDSRELVAALFGETIAREFR